MKRRIPTDSRRRQWNEYADKISKNPFARSAKVEQTWGNYIKKRFGITPDDYYRMYKKQKYCCAICKGAPVGKSRLDNIVKLHIDHDHGSGKVRGLLCSRCNTGLGNFRDRPEFLLMAVLYLIERTPCLEYLRECRSLN